MRKTLITIILCCTAFCVSHAQHLNFIGRVNLGVGLDYRSLDFNGNEVLYSPGGGMGLELGLEYLFTGGLSSYVTAGYQLHLAIQSETFNGVSNTTSFNFNKKFFTLGANQFLELSEGVLNGLIIGAGINYNFPGQMTREENNTDLGTIEYNPALGFHIDARLRLKFTEAFILDPGLRFRKLDFTANSFSEGNVSDLPNYLIKANASGIELSVTLIKKIY